MDLDSGEVQHPLIVAFKTFIAEQSFPCLGAKAALARDQLEVMTARDIRSNWDDLTIVPSLECFAQRYKRGSRLFVSFAVVFEGPKFLTEEEFEHHLWTRLQSLSDKDSMFGHRPDRRVTSDAREAHFSISFGGEAFFVVGMHPAASRPARKFLTPVIVFNLHDQFVKLRENGQYEKIREAIIKRDVALAGTSNPMLMEHGQGSEARQYSGRAVEDDWECPFERSDFSWPKTD